MGTNMLDFKTAEPVDFPAIAQLVFSECASADKQCIQSATGETAGSLVEEMEKWHASNEMVWVCGRVSGQIIAAMGAEFDPEVGRAWLRGPFARRDFPAVSEKLWTLLRAALPANILRFDTFLNAENVRGQAFYTAAGFSEKGRAHVYAALRPDYDQVERARIPAHRVVPLTAALHESFAALHDATFPGTFYLGKQITSKLDADHRVWVHSVDDEVLGYLYGVKESWSEEGYVEFLGVSEKARGRGVGGALLLAALDWFFAQGLPGAGLTVDDGNTNARSLYERVGFRLKFTGVNQRLTKNA